MFLSESNLTDGGHPINRLFHNAMRRKANNIFPLSPRAKLARRASNTLFRDSRANDNAIAGRGFEVFDRITWNNRHNRRDLEGKKLIGVTQTVCRKIDSEAPGHGGLDRLNVRLGVAAGQNRLVSVTNDLAALVCGRQFGKRFGVNLIGRASKIARLVVTPQLSRMQFADLRQEILPSDPPSPLCDAIPVDIQLANPGIAAPFFEGTRIRASNLAGGRNGNRAGFAIARITGEANKGKGHFWRRELIERPE